MTEWSWPDSRVVRVIDGDSLVAEVTKVTDIGFHGVSTVTFRQKLRLNRINTPPARTAEGIAATQATTALVTGQLLNITTVGPYKYGDEWMAEILLPGDINLSDELVRQGLAVYWDGTGPRPGG